MIYHRSNDNNDVTGVYSHVFGRSFTIDEWNRKIKGKENCIDTCNGFVWNRHEVCTNPKTAILVEKNGCSLKIRFGECRFGFVASYDYSHRTGGSSSPTCPTDDDDLYESEYDAVTALLRMMMDACDRNLVHLAKVAYAEYTSKHLQLSLF